MGSPRIQLRGPVAMYTFRLWRKKRKAGEEVVVNLFHFFKDFACDMQQYYTSRYGFYELSLLAFWFPILKFVIIIKS